MEEIAPRIYVETGFRLVNVGAVVTDAGVICIDVPPYPADARRWKLQAQQLHPHGILYLINTDHYRERVLGSQWLGAPVITHQSTSERLRTYGNTFPQALVDALASRDPDAVDDLARVKVIQPEIVFDNGLTFHFGDQTIELLHRPGSAPGSTWICCPAQRVLFTGGTLVTDTHPNLIEADTRQWLAVLEEMQRSYPGVHIVPGRGRVTDVRTVDLLARYVGQIRNRVSELHSFGRPRSDTSSLVSEFLPMFPILEDTRDRTQRRIKAGVDRVYDELREGEKE